MASTERHFLSSIALMRDEELFLKASLDVPVEVWHAHTGHNSHDLQGFLEHTCMYTVVSLAQQTISDDQQPRIITS